MTRSTLRERYQYGVRHIHSDVNVSSLVSDKLNGSY